MKMCVMHIKNISNHLQTGIDLMESNGRDGIEISERKKNWEKTGSNLYADTIKIYIASQTNTANNMEPRDMLGKHFKKVHFESVENRFY